MGGGGNPMWIKYLNKKQNIKGGLNRMENDMKKEKNCLDCLNCKLINHQKELTCKMDLWQKGDGNKKFVILTPYEVKTIDIKSREVFHKAETCEEMILMD